MITMPIELYTDGSCLRNPGQGGYAYIIRYWDTPEGKDIPEPKTIEGSQGFRLTTNNRMEIMAAIEGVSAIIAKIKDGTFTGATQINMGSDSEYLVNSINQKWYVKWAANNWMTSGWKDKQPSPVKNKDLWEKVIAFQDELRSLGVNFTATHIKGHNGHEFNEQVDQMANDRAKDGMTQIVDTVYEQTMTSYNRR